MTTHSILSKNSHLKEIWENALKFQKTSEFKKMLSTFKKHLENSMTLLNQKSSFSTPSAILFHKLKSSARQLGLHDLGEFAALLEEQIQKETGTVDDHQVNYREKCNQAIHELDEWIKFTRQYQPKDE